MRVKILRESDNEMENILRESDEEAEDIRVLLNYVYDRQRRLVYELRLIRLLQTLYETKTEAARISAMDAVVALREELYENSRHRVVTIVCNKCKKDLVSVTQEWDGKVWGPLPVLTEHTCEPPPPPLPQKKCVVS